MLASFIPWLTVPAVPWIPRLTAIEKGAAAGGLLALAEILFWVGVLLAGRPSWTAVKSRGWRGAPREIWELLR